MKTIKLNEHFTVSRLFIIESLLWRLNETEVTEFETNKYNDLIRLVNVTKSKLTKENKQDLLDVVMEYIKYK